MDDIMGVRIETLKELRQCLRSLPRRKLALIYLYTHWCPKCRIIRFEYNIAFRHHGEKVQYISANMDQAPAVCELLGITADDIPAVVIFRNNNMLDRKKLITQKDFMAFDYPPEPPTPESSNTTLAEEEDESATNDPIKKSSGKTAESGETTEDSWIKK